jgi:hypothetical protein
MSLFHPSAHRALDANGNPISGATWTFYLSGTTTLTPVYTSNALSTALSNPVVADSGGKFANIFLDNAISYRAVLKDSGGSTIKDIDPVNGSGTNLATFMPETYGAIGDGITNDTAAFAAMSAAVEAAGGGVISLSPRTYLVGQQGGAGTYQSGSWRNTPQSIIYLNGLTRGVRIEGNGATLKCASGLKYGSFDSGGNATGGISTDNANRATPYAAMIDIWLSAGPILIENLELDGNNGTYVLGGLFGDTGRQIPCNGVRLLSNTGETITRNVYSHHHGLDGTQIQYACPDEDSPKIPVLWENVRCEYNSRQGHSLVGGRGHTHLNCRYANTGRGAFSSPPAANLDIEAEGTFNRDHLFIGCEFVDSVGASVIADSGDSKRLTFMNCQIRNAYGWSAWPNKPGFRFVDCLIAGPMVSAYDNNLPGIIDDNCPQFVRCRITGEASFSTSGTWTNDAQLMRFDGHDGGILFEDCQFIGGLLGPGVTFGGGAVYRGNNYMNFTAGPSGSLGGWLEGTLIYEGTVNWAAGPLPRMPNARLVYRGTEQRRSTTTVDLPSIAAGAEHSFTVTVPGTAVGEPIIASFSVYTAGLIITSAQMSASETATIIVKNTSGGAIDQAPASLIVRALS